ncbi:uncharacterized protein MELLADRAFT_102769 [Melampsora larici-populina 98AG31]|uniref:RING-type domain-containing protein n=1 Tax=Melampsora larici-populina (strain 98AG31 / pathotype 3-4-7) TaxID=747676 RepID=F4R9B4_MELLP|nr:uncharacterized protein MELLADRAFT_102769 [Melampsora larici-populina 98AG31]EGG10958.1 hypothetical protein MELLADRAFT_102769 [Melampsora larici-populina 98AG31]
METFVCLWLMAVIISRSVGQGFMRSKSYFTVEHLSKKLQTLPTFEPINSMIESKVKLKEECTSKVMRPKDRKRKKLSILQRWGEISWQIDDISDTFSFSDVRALLEVIISSNTTPINSENKFIYHAAESLEKEELNIIQRIWVLGALKVLRDYSLETRQPLLSNHIQEGPLCRAGLELSLTQSTVFTLHITFGDVEEDVTLIFNKNFHLSALLEGLQRVELLRRINKWSQRTHQVETSGKFKMINDSLLQVDCPIELKKSMSLANECLGHMMKSPDSTEEVKWTYRVLYHLYSSCEELREAWKSNLGSPQLQTIRKSMSKQMKYKEVVKNDIERYLSSGNPDPFISNLLLTFKDLLPVTLGHYKYIIDCFEAQDKETHPSQLKDYWLNISYYHRSLYARRFVINLLLKASPYIQDTRQYLASRLKIKDGIHQYIPLKNSKTENHNKEGLECSICLNEFVLGEHCLRLDCNPKHIFHHKCLMKWTNEFSGKVSSTDQSKLHANCPVCRTAIGPEITTSQHVFWWEDQSIHQNSPAVLPVIEDHMIKEGSRLAQEPNTSKSGSLPLPAKRPRIDDEADELDTMEDKKKFKVS